MSAGLVASGCLLDPTAALREQWSAPVGFEDPVLELLLAELNYLEQVCGQAVVWEGCGGM
jgi:hypothetical protein